jgi:hypothetical protein
MPIFFGEMYVFNLWTSICEDIEMFADQVHVLEAIYVDTQEGGCKIGKQN